MLWVAVSADRYELPYAVAESGIELAHLLDTTLENVYKKRSLSTSGKICGYRVVTVNFKEDRGMKYRILEAFKVYLMESMNKNTAKKYYASVKGVLKEAAFDELYEVESEFIERQMKELHSKNDFSAAKMGLLKLQEFDPSLQLPNEQFFKEEAKHKTNQVKSRGQKIYKDTIVRKINKIADPELKLAYRLEMISGLRISELADLKPEDIHISGDQKGQIEIYVRNGKGGKSGTVTCLKDDFVKEGLRKLLKRREPGTYLFYRAGHMMNEANRHGFACHDLRRIFAQDLELYLLQEGSFGKEEAADEVRIALRHSQIKTTNLYLKGKSVMRERSSKREDDKDS